MDGFGFAIRLFQRAPNTLLLSLWHNYKTEFKTEFLRERLWIVSWEPLKDFFQHFLWKKNFTTFKVPLQNKF